MIESYPPKSALVRAVGLVRGLAFFGLLAGTILFFGLWLIPAALLLKKGKFIQWMNVTYLKIAMPLFGVRVHVDGREHLSSRNTVMVCNHQSWMDITAILTYVRFPAFLAKKEIESWPYFGATMKLVHCVFVDRSDRRSRHVVAEQIKQKLALGADFCIYPEGTRSPDGKLGDFSGGAFRIAVDAEALLTPVVIDESWWILNKKGLSLYPGTVRFRILPPIDTSLPENRDAKELTKRVHGQMLQALAQMRQEPAASGFSRPENSGLSRPENSGLSR